MSDENTRVEVESEEKTETTTEVDASAQTQETNLMSEETVESDEEESAGEQTKMEKAQAQIEEFRSALQRERADFINYKKRVEREKIELRKNHMGEIMMKIFPIIDDFDRAMASLPEDVRENDWFTGFKMIHKKFQDFLDNLGIEQLDPVGEEFDPNFHEAIGSEDSDEYESGQVTVVLQKGYVTEDRCLRPAIVKVAN